MKFHWRAMPITVICVDMNFELSYLCIKNVEGTCKRE